MPEWEGLGKLFIGIGLAIAVVGVLFVLADRIPGIGYLFSWVGNLPGDLFIKRDNFSLFLPLGTSIVLSVVLSLVFYFLSWMFHR